MSGIGNDDVAGGSRKTTVKPRRKMSAYGYFASLCREFHELTYPGENVYAEINYKCFKRWKKMTARDRWWFDASAAADKLRFEREMANYIPPESRRKRRKRKLKKPDPNFPKRPLTAFSIFCNEKRRRVKISNPELKFDAIDQELGQLWAELSQEEKTAYGAKAKEEKADYQAFLEYLNRSSTAERAEDADDEKDDEEDVNDDDDEEGDEEDDGFNDEEDDNEYEDFTDSEDDASYQSVQYERI